MSKTLYTRDILKLAMSNAHEGRLENYDGSAELRSRTCGSRILVDVQLSKTGALLDLGMDIHACAFGQASASILSNGATGKTLEELEDTAAQLASYLAKKTAVPKGWPDLEMLAVAQDYPGRHAAILLPFQTLIAAIKDALSYKSFAINGGEAGDG